jgi:hypothetical protein
VHLAQDCVSTLVTFQFFFSLKIVSPEKGGHKFCCPVTSGNFPHDAGSFSFISFWVMLQVEEGANCASGLTVSQNFRADSGPFQVRGLFAANEESAPAVILAPIL